MTLNGIDPLQGRKFQVKKRDGRWVDFDETRIYLAIEAAFRDVYQIPESTPLDQKKVNEIREVANKVSGQALSAAIRGEELDVEKIQDLVEMELMRQGHLSVAKSYILYREERRRARALRGEKDHTDYPSVQINIIEYDGTTKPLDIQKIKREIMLACRGYEGICSWQELLDETIKNLYDGVKEYELEQAMIYAARSRIERDPAYSYVAARLLLNKLYRETLGCDISEPNFENTYRQKFPAYIKFAVQKNRLDERLLTTYDLNKLSESLAIKRDEKFAYMGLQTVYDRYLIHHEDHRLETPQYFWMRVAMGLALLEDDPTRRAIEFYDVLSNFYFISSTPTLFNSGTRHPQLSSCYISTVNDDLEHIFKVISDDAKLSKWAGGLGNDWTNVRATGSRIQGTNGVSQGVIPFLKVANDTAVAVNQGGKRKGAMCAYLETWHYDIEDFLELRKNTGDDRRRTHDMNTANWIPDLFMRRVRQGGVWTLFSPNETPDLHDLYGKAFEERYLYYESLASQGKIKIYKQVQAEDLWRKMLTMLFETGHPWLTFKDPSNLRSPQSHVGVIHSSNLCTEILLNTSTEEVAVCNLGSVNLVAHIKNGNLDRELLAQTIKTAMRMLDNVIDINFYPIPEAKNANLRHRPVGLGLMGFQDSLYALRIPYASQEAVEFADRTMEFISYHAILSSALLAKERGPYSSFKGSKWDQGILPLDSIEILRQHRLPDELDVNTDSHMDWTPVRETIKKYGMRNSNCLAIAPTATISNIIGVSQSIEPTFKNLYVKSNLSGEFTIINTYLVEDLKSRNLWDDQMLDDLKYYDGELAEIERIPYDIKHLYQTAYDIEPYWLIEAASRRQKWIDMGQSLNLYIAQPSGKKLSEMYQLAWIKGLKTTYYLRSKSATSIEKSTQDINRRGLQPRWMKNQSASSRIRVQRDSPEQKLNHNSYQTVTPQACSIMDTGCESCQ
ncbi:MAG: ribonucleoside-diphosphate reductase subunit alpha [Verrucomicrobiae bacterium]|nr:ribonucleoside-diphosphate reductase subunit alpha [Verrucomicrobiae bacterium]